VFASVLGAVADGAPELRDIIITGTGTSDDGHGHHGGAVADGLDRITVHRWSPAEETPASPSWPVAPTGADDQAFWLYSSGTTGKPKGVMHLHRSPQATFETYAHQVLDVGEQDRFLSVAKLFFAYGLGNSLTFPFAVGATAILNPDPPSPAAVLELIAQEQPTLFFSSPGFCAALLDVDAPVDTFASIRATVTAGESLPATIQTRFAELTGSPVLDGIGSTELLHIFISNTLTQQRAGSSGWLVPGYEAELRDDNNQVVTEPDSPGYLHVRGPSASVGYHQRPEVTAATFGDGWVRTGDVYLRAADDCWTFLGRNNDMIKAGGIWVSPAEVESVLIEHPTVREAAVVGTRNEQGLEEAVAFVIAAAGADISTEQLEVHCRERMAAFKRPRQLHVVDDFPRTATGKIKRFELRQALDTPAE
jgi:benzoate-CoA ligase